MKFELTKEQMQKFKEWSAKHKAVYTGAIGGRYTFEFTPTSIEIFCRVKDFVTKEELDL